MTKHPTDYLKEMRARFSQDRQYINGISKESDKPSVIAYANTIEGLLSELNTRMQQLIDVMGGEV